MIDLNWTNLTNLIISVFNINPIGLKSFACAVCGRGFYDEKSLHSHKSIHTGLKQFKCTECGKLYSTANILQQHSKKHLPVRPHRCSECPREFHTANELRVHFRIHTQEQPYLCCQCGKQFTRKTHLNIHMSEFFFSSRWKATGVLIWLFNLLFCTGTHTGIKPFKCQFCDKAFALSGDLTAHIRVRCWAIEVQINLLNDSNLIFSFSHT